jgi:hypothetical protein
MAVGAAPDEFRLQPPALERAAQLINERGEITWFGFVGAFEAGGIATNRLLKCTAA